MKNYTLQIFLIFFAACATEEYENDRQVPKYQQNADESSVSELSLYEDSGEDILNYYPFFKSRDGFVSREDGNQHSVWKARKYDTGAGYEVNWGKHKNPETGESFYKIEHFSLKAINGKGYAFVNKFCDRYSNREPCWNIRTRKAQIKIGPEDWQTIIDRKENPFLGKPLGIRDIPTKTYAVRVWGYIETKAGDVGREFFWVQRWLPPAPRTNPVWRNPKKNTRMAVVKKQAWWDSKAGWRSGSGEEKDGSPTGRHIKFGRQSSLGKNLGYQWTFTHLEKGTKGGLSTFDDK